MTGTDSLNTCDRAASTKRSARTVRGRRETSCTSCKTSGRHSFWRLTSLALLAREHETRDRRAADHTDRGASHHSFIGDSPARSSYPTRISPPCPDGEGGTVGDRNKKKKEREREKKGKKNNLLNFPRSETLARCVSIRPRPERYLVCRWPINRFQSDIRASDRRKYFRAFTRARQRSLSGDFIVSQIIKSLVDTGLNASIFRLVGSEHGHDEFLVKLDQVPIRSSGFDLRCCWTWFYRRIDFNSS